MRWLELFLFGKPCDIGWHWRCCYSQLVFQVHVSQSRAQASLCKGQFGKELLIAVSRPEHRCKLQCMSPQQGKIIGAHIKFIELKQGEVVVPSFELIVALQLDNFVL